MTTPSELLDEAILMLDTAIGQMDVFGAEAPPFPIAVVCKTLQGQHMGLNIPNGGYDVLSDAIHDLTVHEGIQPVSWLVLSDAWLTFVDEDAGTAEPCEALVVAVATGNPADECMVVNRYHRTPDGLVWHPREFNHGPTSGPMADVLRASFAYRN